MIIDGLQNLLKFNKEEAEERKTLFRGKLGRRAIGGILHKGFGEATSGPLSDEAAASEPGFGIEN